MTAVPLSGNKAEAPRLVELDCLHGQENVQAAGVRVCDLASFRNTDRGPCVSHAGAVDRLLRSGGRGLKNFDLQYFTHTIDGKLYGGWFRILAPSQLEVLDQCWRPSCAALRGTEDPFQRSAIRPVSSQIRLLQFRATDKRVLSRAYYRSRHCSPAARTSPPGRGAYAPSNCRRAA
jgi:hypothetical protein